MRLQSYLISADEIKTLKIGFVEDTISRNRMLNILNMYCYRQNFIFESNFAQTSIEQRLNGLNSFEQMKWIECYLYLSLIQTIYIQDITSIYIIDGNNIFFESKHSIKIKNMIEYTQIMDNLTKQYKDVFVLFVFDYSILKFVRGNPEFEKLYLKYPMTIVRKGVQADEIILYSYSMLKEFCDVKIITLDKYRDYRNRYDFDSYDLIPIKNLKSIKRFLKNRMLLEEI